MSKRFTDTELWKEDWFVSLPTAFQFFWLYLKDNCDHAGIWRPNLTTFFKLYGYEIKLSLAIENINNGKERIVLLKNGRLFLTGFVPFQYGCILNLNNRMHNSVYQHLLTNEVNLTSIRPQLEVTQGVKDKDKDKDKGSSLSLPVVKESKQRNFQKPTIQEIIEYSKSIDFDLDATKFFDYYQSKGWVIGKSSMKDWKACVRTWKTNGYGGTNGRGNTNEASDGTSGKYSHLTKTVIV